MNDIKEMIRRFIVSSCLPGESPENLRHDTPLLTSGIVDSLALVNLVSFLEQEFHVELNVYDTSIEQFDCIDDIARCVTRKQRVGASASR